MKKTIFLDFDGTITKVDTCAAMVESFARDGWQEINRQWERGELSTEECANKTFKLFDATPAKLKDLLDKVEIDDYFQDFCQFCRAKGYPVYILSDGYDFNIKTILEKYELDIPYYCNQLIYSNEFRIRCPYGNDDCGNCGTCKTTLMLKLKEKDSQAVYIGDGYSDVCPATKADVVFAKDTLYEICREKGIQAIAYRNFKDIIIRMKEE